MQKSQNLILPLEALYPVFANPAPESAAAAGCRFSTVFIPATFVAVTLKTMLMKTEVIRIPKTKAVFQCCFTAFAIAAFVCMINSASVKTKLREISHTFITNILEWESI